MQDNNRSSLGAKALQTFCSRLVIALLGVLGGILVARALGPDGKGAYSAVQTLVSVPVALMGGVGSAITFLIAKERWSVRDMLPALAVLFAAFTLLSLAGTLLYAATHGWSPTAIAFAAAMPPSIVLAWQQGYYVAIDRLRAMNLQTLAQAAGTLVLLAAACFVFHGGTVGALAAWVVATYLCAAVVAIDMFRSGGALHRIELRTRVSRILCFGSQSSLNAGLGLLNYRIDSLILAALLGLASFGIYSIAVNLGEMLFLVLRPVNVAVGRDIGASTAERSAQITADTVRLGFLIALVFAAAVFALGPTAIHLVYGGRFDGAALPLRLLLPGIVVFGSAGTFASYFIFQLGKPLIVAWINAGMIAVQSAACFALVPHYGMAGAAVASSITYLIGAMANTVLFTRSAGVSAPSLWIPRFSDAGRLFDIVRRALPHRKGAAAGTAQNALVVTGAAGSVATLIRPFLREKYALRLTDRARVTGRTGGEVFLRADLSNLRAMRRLMRGARAVVHLGGISKESTFEKILDANIRGMRTVLEAARLEGVRRVVFASTGHVVGFYPRTVFVEESAPMRPDTLYAASKGFGELLARYYADKFGMEIVCIRIGHVSEAPEYDVDDHIWISPRDLSELIDRAIEHPSVHCEVVFGISRNARRWWSLERARALGYEPADGVADERAVKKISNANIGEIVQGESFAASGFEGSLLKILEL